MAVSQLQFNNSASFVLARGEDWKAAPERVLRGSMLFDYNGIMPDVSGRRRGGHICVYVLLCLIYRPD